jgi:hypothetical protein
MRWRLVGARLDVALTIVVAKDYATSVSHRQVTSALRISLLGPSNEENLAVPDPSASIVIDATLLSAGRK